MSSKLPGTAVLVVALVGFAAFLGTLLGAASMTAVSYTHLDVYKRQAYEYVMARQKEAIAAGADPAAAQSMAGEKQNSMLRREALPEEQAASILFLASDDASHMTGAIVATDGGWASC